MQPSAVYLRSGELAPGFGYPLGVAMIRRCILPKRISIAVENGKMRERQARRFQRFAQSFRPLDLDNLALRSDGDHYSPGMQAHDLRNLMLEPADIQGFIIVGVMRIDPALSANFAGLFEKFARLDCKLYRLMGKPSLRCIRRASFC